VGATVVEPEAGCVPFTPVIVTDVAFCVAHVNVTCCPEVTLAGDAVKLVTTGCDPPDGVSDLEFVPPHEAIPNTETAPTNSAVQNFNFKGPM